MKRRFLALLLALGLLLPGCAGRNNDQVVYNADHSNCIYSDRCILITDLFSAELVDQQTGERRSFPLDAEGNASCSAGALFQRGREVYYLKTRHQTNSSGSIILSSIEELVAMDLQTLEERVIYRFSWEQNWFFGMLDLPPKDIEMSIVYTFFVHGGYFYFVSNLGLCRMSLLTGQYELYGADIPRQHAYDGQNLYYTDGYNRLVTQNLDTGKSHTVEEVVASNFVYTPQGVYYVNILSDNTLWHYDPATGKAEKISDLIGSSLDFDENSLYLHTDDGSFVRLSLSGEELARAEIPGSVVVPYQGEFLYRYSDLQTEDGDWITQLYQIRKSDLTETLLT